MNENELRALIASLERKLDSDGNEYSSSGDNLILSDSEDARGIKRISIDDLTGLLVQDKNKDTKIQADDSDNIRLDTYGVERMIIDSSGDVGVGGAISDIYASGFDAQLTIHTEDGADIPLGNPQDTIDASEAGSDLPQPGDDGFEAGHDLIARFHSSCTDELAKGLRIGSFPASDTYIGGGAYLDIGVDAANSEAGLAYCTLIGQQNSIIGSADLTGAALVFDANNDVRINTQLAIGTDPGDSTSTTLSILGANGSSSGLWFIKSGDVDNIFSIVQTTSQLQFHHQSDSSAGFATIGYISATTGEYYDNVSFTGQHRMACSPGLLDSNYIGLIASSKGIYKNISGGIKPTINDALPEIELSTIRNDKRVYGVISNIEDSESREFMSGRFVSHFKKEDDDRLIINSLGEGGIWVCDINGNLENGDYITTCEIPGYGMKQDDDLLHNYSVAKITCDCNFDLNSNIYDCIEFEFNGQIYKKAFVGCTYHCG